VSPLSPPAEARPPRVLCYSPYNYWALHALYETTILHGLRLRGADIRYVLCDGMFSDCDMFWASQNPRTPLSCSQCQARVTGIVAGMNHEWEWLGRSITRDEMRAARVWERSLASEELATATDGDLEIGAWVRSSVHSHLRANSLDPADPAVEQALRSYAFSGRVAAYALERLLDDYQPDVLLVFNGRLSSTRVALELARRRGIRVVCHERGPLPATLLLTENDHCNAIAPPRAVGEAWKDVPLSAPELETTEQYLLARERGTSLNWTAFSPPPQDLELVRTRLGLEASRPVWVLFTSSTDEVVSNEDWTAAFAQQHDWVERTVAYTASNPELDLVIRVHPNSGSSRSGGRNEEELRQFEELSLRLPPNVSLVMPEDDVSSYSLMNLATVGLVFHSTVALELAAKGKHVVVAGSGWIGDARCVRRVRSEADYAGVLDEARRLPVGAVDPEIKRTAYRYAHSLFFRRSVPFPLVRMLDPQNGEPAYTSLHDLAPGRDAGLDRAVCVVLGEESAQPTPSVLERDRTTEAEESWFGLAATRPLSVLAFADELIEDETLLGAWSEAFSAADAVTLVIDTPAELTEALVGAASGHGLDRDDAAELVAVPGRPDGVAAVLSRRDHGLDVPTAPVDPAALREFARSGR
jgi:hypothetical protein